MRKIHIAALLMAGVAIFLFVRSSAELSTYGSFSDAQHAKNVKIVGTLAPDPRISYDPEVDANHFSFFMQDEDGLIKKVVLNEAKPQDFERSDQIVVSGKLNGEVFEAEDILLKCPSKYKDEELYIRSEKKEA